MDTIRADERVAAIAERLAALLAAGLPADQARGHLRRTEDAVTIERLDRALDGQDESGDGGLWSALGAAWRIGVRAGVPLRKCLEAIAEVARDDQRLKGEREVLLAGPAASARLMLALPFVGIALGFVMGLNPVASLFSMPAGGIVLVTGVGLILLGRRWSRRLLRSLARARPVGMVLELLAMALGAEGTVTGARSMVAGEWGEADEEERRIEIAVLELAGVVGIPAAGLLRAEAARLRHQALVDQRSDAARLGVRLLLPLGACVLPAFVLLAVVPVLVAIISSTTSSWR